jgi:hypothetical protein
MPAHPVRPDIERNKNGPRRKRRGLVREMAQRHTRRRELLEHCDSALGHVWTAPWQELSDGLQHWSGAVTCPAC